MPPKQTTSIKLREQPGWVTFSLDGKYAYPSTGEVIDTATKKIVAALTDEKGARGPQREDGRDPLQGRHAGDGRRPVRRRAGAVTVWSAGMHPRTPNRRRHFPASSNTADHLSGVIKLSMHRGISPAADPSPCGRRSAGPLGAASLRCPPRTRSAPPRTALFSSCQPSVSAGTTWYSSTGSLMFTTFTLPSRRQELTLDRIVRRLRDDEPAP